MFARGLIFVSLLLTGYVAADQVTVNDGLWKSWCQGGAKPGYACFSVTPGSGAYADYSVDPQHSANVVFSQKLHFFGVKCPPHGSTDEVTIFRKNKRPILVDAVQPAVAGQVCCSGSYGSGDDPDSLDLCNGQTYPVPAQ
ncbi:hypothetical protein BCV70DRAFT_196722 [Testicularia cyperi]|uniref:Uncharacterized protein n=1 Tax=Testicularia cyperi TaxID=1882483 RepID=A0A317XX64_9BASI|nr:hypothetical protein BCV70DRAFT_196722 [Testicularia cyperi]